jgi:hypothetical protein
MWDVHVRPSSELHAVMLLSCCLQFTYTMADARRSPVTNDEQIRYRTAAVTVVAGAVQALLLCSLISSTILLRMALCLEAEPGILCQSVQKHAMFWMP